MSFDELEQAISIIDAHKERDAQGWKKRTKTSESEWTAYWTYEKQGEVLGAEATCRDYKKVKDLFCSFRQLEAERDLYLEAIKASIERADAYAGTRMSDAELEKMAQELYDGFMDGKYRPIGMKYTSKSLDLVEAISLALRTVRDTASKNTSPTYQLPSEEQAKKLSYEFHGGSDYAEGFMSCYDWLLSQLVTAKPISPAVVIPSENDLSDIIHKHFDGDIPRVNFQGLHGKIFSQIKTVEPGKRLSDEDMENEAAYFHLDHPKMSASQMFFEGARWVQDRLLGEMKK